eukprot:SAG31_NODE_683_length_12836_cov_8.304938_5_plen_138_part_00
MWATGTVAARASTGAQAELSSDPERKGIGLSRTICSKPQHLLCPSANTWLVKNPGTTSGRQRRLLLSAREVIHVHAAVLLPAEQFEMEPGANGVRWVQLHLSEAEVLRLQERPTVRQPGCKCFATDRTELAAQVLIF